MHPYLKPLARLELLYMTPLYLTLRRLCAQAAVGTSTGSPTRPLRKRSGARTRKVCGRIAGILNKAK